MKRGQLSFTIQQKYLGDADASAVNASQPLAAACAMETIMDQSLRQLCEGLREKRGAALSGRAGAREAFTEACLHGLPALLDGLYAAERLAANERTPLGISSQALENVNFFLWIGMRTLNYLAILLCFSIWMFTQVYASLTTAQTVCALLFFVLQLVVTFPDSILYERKEFETVRRAKSPITRFSVSVIMIAVAVFQFAFLGFAVTH